MPLLNPTDEEQRKKPQTDLDRLLAQGGQIVGPGSSFAQPPSVPAPVPTPEGPPPEEARPDLTLGRLGGAFTTGLTKDIPREMLGEPTMYSEFQERHPILSDVMQALPVVGPVIQAKTLGGKLLKWTGLGEKAQEALAPSPEFEGPSSGHIEDFVRGLLPLGIVSMATGLAGGAAVQAGATRAATKLGTKLSAMAARKAFESGAKALPEAQIFSQIAGGDYQRHIDAGVDPDRAMAASIFNASIQTPLMGLPLGKVLTAWRPERSLRQKAFDLLTAMGTGAAIGFAQQYPNEFSDIWAKDPKQSSVNALGTFIGELPEMTKRAAVSGLQMAVAGGLFAAPGALRGGRGAVAPTPEQLAAHAAEHRTRVLDDIRTDFQAGKISLDNLMAMTHESEAARLGLVDDLNKLIIERRASQLGTEPTPIVEPPPTEPRVEPTPAREPSPAEESAATFGREFDTMQGPAGRELLARRLAGEEATGQRAEAFRARLQTIADNIRKEREAAAAAAPAKVVEETPAPKPVEKPAEIAAPAKEAAPAAKLSEVAPVEEKKVAPTPEAKPPRETLKERAARRKTEHEEVTVSAIEEVKEPETLAPAAQEMARLQANKPRPLNKLYGPNPTEEQIASHAESMKAWNKEYRAASKAQKIELEQANQRAAEAAKAKEFEAKTPMLGEEKAKEPWEMTKAEFEANPPEGFVIKKLSGKEDIAQALPDGRIALDPDNFFGHPPDIAREIIEHERSHFLEAKISPEDKARLFDNPEVMKYRGRNINEKLANMIQDGKLPPEVLKDYPELGKKTPPVEEKAPGVPDEYSALRAISNKANRKPYTPEDITNSRVEALRSVGLIKGKTDLKITQEGFSKLTDWTKLQRQSEITAGDAYDRAVEERIRTEEEAKATPTWKDLKYESEEAFKKDFNEKRMREYGESEEEFAARQYCLNQGGRNSFSIRGAGK